MHARDTNAFGNIATGQDQVVRLLPDLPEMPLWLFESHDDGRLVFFAGAGISMASDLPDFRELVHRVYRAIGEHWFDAAVLDAGSKLPPDQRAEIDAYCRGEYDFQFTLLERRMFGGREQRGTVREAVRDVLRMVAGGSGPVPATPSENHDALMRLSNNGEATAILTTNFDTLFEQTSVAKKLPPESLRVGLDTLPRPDWGQPLEGVLHVHGVLHEAGEPPRPLVLDSLDFADYYVRRRVVPDFLLDVARRHDILFVGYRLADIQVRAVLSAMSLDRQHRDRDTRAALLLPAGRPEPLRPPSTDESAQDETWMGRGLAAIVRYPQSPPAGHDAFDKLLRTWADWSLHHVAGETASETWRSAHDRLEQLLSVSFASSTEADRALVGWLAGRELTTTDDVRRAAALARSTAPGIDPAWVGHIVDALTRERARREPRRTRRSEASPSTVARAFVWRSLKGRMTDRAMLSWFAANAGNRSIERQVLLELLDYPVGRPPDPWRGAWDLVARNGDPPVPASDLRAVRLGHQLKEVGLDFSVARDLVRLLAPRLRFEVPSLASGRPHVDPIHVGDLLRVAFEGSTLEDIPRLDKLGAVDEDALRELVDGLDRHLRAAISLLATVEGHGEAERFHVSGAPRWVAFRLPAFVPKGSGIDRFSRGVTPIVKSLDAAAKLLASRDPRTTMAIANGWLTRAHRDDIHVRLWASLALEFSGIASPETLEQVITTLDDAVFWHISRYPEVVQLRVRRFMDLSRASRRAVLDRIRRLAGPSERAWTDNDREYWLLYDAVVEMERYRRAWPDEVSADDLAWLDMSIRSLEARGGQLALAAAEVRDTNIELYWGLMPGGGSGWVSPDPDSRFDGIEGEERLSELEAALSEGEHWQLRTTAGKAFSWLELPGNSSKILAELSVSTVDAPLVWRSIGHARAKVLGRAPGPVDAGLRPEAFDDDAAMALAARLPVDDLARALDGLASWSTFHAKKRGIEVGPGFDALWKCLVPVAVSRASIDADPNASIDQRLERAADTTPLGDLVAAFENTRPEVDAFASRKEVVERWAVLVAVLDARDTSEAARAIMLRVLVRSLGYFGRVAPAIVARHVRSELELHGRLPPDIARALWGGIKRIEDVNAIPAGAIAAILDEALSTDTRRDLLYLVAFSSIRARTQTGHAHAFDDATIQQTLRAIPPMLRAGLAARLSMFLHEGAAWFIGDGVGDNPDGTDEGATRARLFRWVIAPFLASAWPHDRAFVLPGVAAGFARVPAAAGNAFAEAVEAVRWALVPFSSYGIQVYGFWYDDGAERDPERGLATIAEVVRTPDDARALLDLLDLTIQDQREGEVWALRLLTDRIVALAPDLATDRRHRRLAARATRAEE